MIPSRLQRPEFRFTLLNGKIPILKDWQHSNNFTFDDEKIRKHKGNIGVVCGYNNLVVVDIDKNPDETLNLLLEKLPKTFCVKTGKQGYHLYYFVDDIKNLKSTCLDFNGSHLDIQAQGKQVVCPGAIHPETKKEYEVFLDKPIVHINSSMLAPFLKREKGEGQQGKDDSRSALEYQNVCRFIRRGSSKEEIFKQMEAFDKWNGATDAYREHTYNKALEFIDRVEKPSNPERAKGILERTVDLRTAAADGVPDVEWRVYGMVPKSGTVVIGGDPASRKSWIAEHIALCVATGKRVFGEFQVEPCNTLYVDQENGRGFIIRRFAQLNDGETESLPDNLFLVIYEDIRLDEPKDKIILQELVKEKEIGLVVLDSLARFLSGDEDRSSDMRRLFDNVKDLFRNDEEVSVLILHHLKKERGKSSMLSLRGSGDLSAMASMVWLCSKTGPRVAFECMKNRLTDDMERHNLVFDSDGVDGPVKIFIDGNVEVINRSVRCCDALVKWIVANNRKNFRWGEGLQAVEDAGHSKNAYAEAMKKLRAEGVVSKTKKVGIYQYNTFPSKTSKKCDGTGQSGQSGQGFTGPVPNCPPIWDSGTAGQFVETEEIPDAPEPTNQELVDIISEKPEGYDKEAFCRKYGEARCEALLKSGDLYESPTGVLRCV